MPDFVPPKKRPSDEDYYEKSLKKANTKKKDVNEGWRLNKASYDKRSKKPKGNYKSASTPVLLNAARRIDMEQQDEVRNHNDSSYKGYSPSLQSDVIMVPKKTQSNPSSALNENVEKQRYDAPKSVSKPSKNPLKNKLDSSPLQNKSDGKKPPKGAPLQNKPASKKMPKGTSPQNKSANNNPSKNKATKKKLPEKKQGRSSYIVYYVLLIIAAVGILSVLSVTVLFNVSEIKVVGDTRYSDEEIIEKSGIKIGDNLIRMDTESGLKAVSDGFIYLENVSIKKAFPSAIVITVNEAVPLANVKAGNEYIVVSQHGKILERSKSPTPDIIIVDGYIPVVEDVSHTIESADKQKTELLFTITEAVKKSQMDKIKSVDIFDRLNITMNYDDRIEIKLGTVASIDEKLIIGKSLIDNELESTGKFVLLLSNLEKATARPIYEQPIVPPEETTAGETAEGEETTANETAEGEETAVSETVAETTLS